ncbi:C6 zinc finger domain-containing protein [Colletotrichum salicis]|uniref:C6 zinc finger domain-containing protein n=1 Tax=Colletotrichum salicis TaxID=1209931 RepID=A0A135SX01_9PEZI|nr:C6 zinc finger domain-containing protein [Colletotrichum salicis]
MTSTSRKLALAVVSPPQAQAQAQTQTEPSNARRRCWECQRRRLVCDSARPVCVKCKTSGVVCPGYEDKKPLIWLAPGKVKTRTWKRKSPSANKKKDNGSSKNGTKGQSESEIAKAVRSDVSGTRWDGTVHIFPGYELRDETCDIIEATLYWNDQVYPFFAANQLTNSPWLVPVSYVQYMGVPIQHALVAMAIDHRMLRLSKKKNDAYQAEVRARFHQHRCTAIQALNEEISHRNEKRRISDYTMAAVIVFLYADLMGSVTADNWRHHLNGFMAIIEMRGGLRSVCDAAAGYKTVILFCKIIENMANTTSPAYDQVSPLLNCKMRDLIQEVYETGYYPFLPCPVELFIDIICVNRLRYLATQPESSDTLDSLQTEAEDLLERIIDFSPETWSSAKTESQDEFLTMAQVYQSAVVVFAIASLQSVCVIPASAGWRAVKTIHGSKLMTLLEKAAGSRVLRSCVMWPMIVAGFDAKTGSAAARSFVSKRLADESVHLGAYLPLATKDILEKFWSSGKKNWDECFDTPYALVT